MSDQTTSRPLKSVPKRVWKPLDVNYERLYLVRFSFPHHPNWNMEKAVFAKSPTHAAELMEKAYEGVAWVEEPTITGHALNVYRPEDWEGVVDVDHVRS